MSTQKSTDSLTEAFYPEKNLLIFAKQQFLLNYINSFKGFKEQQLLDYHEIPRACVPNIILEIKQESEQLSQIAFGIW